MGRIGAGIGLGLVLGPVLAGALSTFGPEAPPLAAAFMALGALGLAAMRMPETRRPGAPGAARPRASSRALLDALSERRLVPVIVMYFLTFISLSTIQVTLALLAKDRLGWGATEIGYLFGLLGLSTLVIQGGLIGRLTRAFGEINLALMGAALIGAGMLLISAAHLPGQLIGGLALFGVGIGVTNPAISSLASRFAPDDQQGAVLGVVQSAGGLARVIGPTAAGMLFAALGPGAPFLGGAAAAGVSLIVGLYLRAIAVDSIPGA
jgi:MFS family permease